MGTARQWPVLQGLLPLPRAQVPGDLLAGITLAALGIPEVMGYTSIAGMPVITGLYTSCCRWSCSPSRVVAPPGGRRGLGDRGGDGRRASSGLADRVGPVRRAGRAGAR